MELGRLCTVEEGCGYLGLAASEVVGCAAFPRVDDVVPGVRFSSENRCASPGATWACPAKPRAAISGAEGLLACGERAARKGRTVCSRNFRVGELALR